MMLSHHFNPILPRHQLMIVYLLVTVSVALHISNQNGKTDLSLELDILSVARLSFLFSLSQIVYYY